MHFHERFLENLLKTRADYRNRDLQGEKGPDRNRELLQENVLRAKEEGCRRIRIRLRTTIRLTEQGAKKCLGQQIRVYLPLPVEYAQVHDYRLWNISPLPKMVAGPEYPQRTAVFETEYSGKETFSAEFEFENVTEYRQPDPTAVLEQGTAAFLLYGGAAASYPLYALYQEPLPGDRWGGDKSPSEGPEDLRLHHHPCPLLLCPSLQHL